VRQTKKNSGWWRFFSLVALKVEKITACRRRLCFFSRVKNKASVGSSVRFGLFSFLFFIRRNGSLRTQHKGQIALFISSFKNPQRRKWAGLRSTPRNYPRAAKCAHGDGKFSINSLFSLKTKRINLIFFFFRKVFMSVCCERRTCVCVEWCIRIAGCLGSFAVVPNQCRQVQ
jgi:hypothetical protein